MRRLNLALAVAVLAVLVVAGVRDWQRRARISQIEAVGGEPERCVSCHPAGQNDGKAHPRVAGHDDLKRLGCTPCHGGDGVRVDAQAHGPAVGETYQPFWPAGFVQVGCVRCHVPGKLRGGERIARGRREYLAAGCPSCHAPGRLIPGLGVDLRYRQHRSLEQLRRRVLDPRHVANQPPGVVMWSLSDATYRGRYADTEAGRRALDDLLLYLLAVVDRPEPFRAGWSPRELTIAADCARCHKPGRARAQGTQHRCAMLVRAPDLACVRCHGAGPPPPVHADARGCPQVRGAAPLCGTCHLRSGDGAQALLEPDPG